MLSSATTPTVNVSVSVSTTGGVPFEHRWKRSFGSSINCQSQPSFTFQIETDAMLSSSASCFLAGDAEDLQLCRHYIYVSSLYICPSCEGKKVEGGKKLSEKSRHYAATAHHSCVVSVQLTRRRRDAHDRIFRRGYETATRRDPAPLRQLCRNHPAPRPLCAHPPYAPPSSKTCPGLCRPGRRRGSRSRCFRCARG